MANGKASEAAEIGRRDLFVASAAAAGLVATVGAGRPTLAQPPNRQQRSRETCCSNAVGTCF